MQYNWITGDNNRDSKTLARIAEEFGVSAKTIERWVSLEHVKQIENRFPQLANYLSQESGKKVTVREIEARFKKADMLTRVEKCPPSESLQQLVLRSLEACDQAGLAAYLAEYCNCDDIQGIHQRLMQSDQQSREEVLDDLQRGIDYAIGRVTDQQQLNILRQLVYVVALLLSTPVIAEGEADLLNDIEDPGPISLLRLHIDAHLLSGGVKADVFLEADYLKSSGAQGLSDTGPRSVRPPRVVKNTVSDYRLWRTAKSLDKTELKKSRVPRPNTEANRKKLKKFMNGLDIRIRRANKTEKHFFLLASHSESSEYIDLVKGHLKNLRIFKTAEGDGIPLFVLDAMETEVWIAECLEACKSRESALKSAAKINRPTLESNDTEVDKPGPSVVYNEYHVNGDFKGNVGDNGNTTNTEEKK